MKDLRSQRHDTQTKLSQAELNLRLVGGCRSAETLAADPFYAGAKAIGEKEVARLQKRLARIIAEIESSDAKLAAVLAKYGRA